MALRDSMVSWWEMNETSGTRYDAHGSYNLTDYNTVGYGTGKKNNAADFESTNSENLRYPGGIGLSSDSDFSISMWLNYESITGGKNLFSYNVENGSNGNQVYADFNFVGANILRFLSGSEVTTSYTWSSFALNTWYHVVFTMDYNTTNGVKIYINGVNVATGNSGSNSINGVTQSNFALGVMQFGGGSLYGLYHDGLMDEVGVWSRVLTSDEVTALYNSGNGLDYAGTAPTVASFIPRTVMLT